MSQKAALFENHFLDGRTHQGMLLLRGKIEIAFDGVYADCLSGLTM
jgi:hypothetical protein